jgi:hypothetical protein
MQVETFLGVYCLKSYTSKGDDIDIMQCSVAPSILGCAENWVFWSADVCL